MNKDAVYTTKFAMWLAKICIATMVIFGALSWSGNHTFQLDFLLYGALMPIITVFVIRSFTHPRKGERLFWILRHKHASRTVAALFTGVAMFGVNHEWGWVRLLHLLFTPAAILAVYIFMYKAQKAKFDRIVALLGIVVGIGGFLWSVSGKFFDYTPPITIALGEALAAIAIVFWLHNTTKIE